MPQFHKIMEDPGQFYFPWRKRHFLSHVTVALTQKGKEWHSFLLVHFFPHSFYFHLSLLQSKYKSRGTKQCYQESTSVLYMPTAIEYLFSPEHSQTHSSLPVFGSSFSCPQLCCPQNYSGKSLSQRAYRSGCIKVYYLIFPTIQPL